MFDEKRFKSFKIKNKDGDLTSVKPKLCLNWRIIKKVNSICLIDDNNQEFLFTEDEAFNVLSFLLEHDHQLYNGVLTLEMIIDRKRNLCSKRTYEKHLEQENNNLASSIPVSSLIRGKSYVLEDQSIVLFLGTVFVADETGKVSKKHLILNRHCIQEFKTNSRSLFLTPYLLSKKVIAESTNELVSEEIFKKNVANVLKQYKIQKYFIFLSTLNPLTNKISFKINIDILTANKKQLLKDNATYYHYNTNYATSNEIVVYTHDFKEVY